MAIQLIIYKNPELLINLIFGFTGFSTSKKIMLEARTQGNGGTVVSANGDEYDAIVVANGTDLQPDQDRLIKRALIKSKYVLTETEYRTILRANKQGRNLLSQLRFARNKTICNPLNAQQLNARLTKKAFGSAVSHVI